MKIDSFAMRSASERTFVSVDKTTVSQKTTQITAPLVNSAKTPANTLPGTTLPKKDPFAKDDAARQAVSLDLSDEGKQHSLITREQIEAARNAKNSEATITAPKSKLPETPEEFRQSLLETLLYFLTGKRFSFRQLDFSISSQQNQQSISTQTWTISTSSFETSHYEFESVSYNTQGIVHTSDGRTINVDVALNMSREAAYIISGSQFTVEHIVDPLVINYNAPSATLTDKKFQFDLTFSGNMQNISFPGQGSGFLAWDRNGDGAINDGRELFGPATGSGFDELRTLDHDQNAWIDENDDIFSKLLIWTKDENGKDILYSLKEAGIGAIYLGDVRTEYSLGIYTAAANGTLRSTSIFLREDGGAGTIQHLDLSV